MNKNYTIIGFEKKNGKKIVIEEGLTKDQAMKSCEEWGWVYDDGKHSYYMSIKEGLTGLLILSPLAAIVESHLNQYYKENRR